jgi:RimJ/RimL family protein N-acetyltransferase
MEPPSLDSTRAYVAYMMSETKADPRVRYSFSILERAQDLVIGDIYMKIHDPAVQIAEVSYGLDPAYWGRGYMSEAVRLMLDFGFERLKLKRIYAVCDPENIGSCRLLEKCGLQYEGRHRCEELIRGVYQDNLYYAILDTDPRSL